MRGIFRAVAGLPGDSAHEKARGTVLAPPGESCGGGVEAQMRSRIGRWWRSFGAGAERARQLRVDLERRGLPAPLASALSERLETRTAALDAAAYQVVLDATCTAWAAQRRATPPDAALEIQRLVQDFAVELQKLDEGLRLLSTYLLRIRDRARSDDGVRLVH
jgi:hypothetical protein